MKSDLYVQQQQCPQKHCLYFILIFSRMEYKVVQFQSRTKMSKDEKLQQSSFCILSKALSQTETQVTGKLIRGQQNHPGGSYWSLFCQWDSTEFLKDITEIILAPPLFSYSVPAASPKIWPSHNPWHI